MPKSVEMALLRRCCDWEAKFQHKWRLGEEWKWGLDMPEEGGNEDLTIRSFRSREEGVGWVGLKVKHKLGFRRQSQTWTDSQFHWSWMPTPTNSSFYPPPSSLLPHTLRSSYLWATHCSVLALLAQPGCPIMLSTPTPGGQYQSTKTMIQLNPFTFHTHKSSLPTGGP